MGIRAAAGALSHFLGGYISESTNFQGFVGQDDPDHSNFRCQELPVWRANLCKKFGEGGSPRMQKSKVPAGPLHGQWESGTGSKVDFSAWATLERQHLLSQ